MRAGKAQTPERFAVETPILAKNARMGQPALIKWHALELVL
jgi:hypothetical protein